MVHVSRDDKRYTEKKNKSERARRKKEDTARLRQLVDLTLSIDPRIKRIKEEEKAAREAKKKGKTGAQNGVSQKQKEEEEKKKAGHRGGGIVGGGGGLWSDMARVVCVVAWW